MASKDSSKNAPARARHARSTAHRARRDAERGQQTVDRFRTAARGFRGVLSGHFPDKVAEVETVAFHLAQVEAQLPTTVEAIRLARYPGAGRRDPRRMALGLCENLSVLQTHLCESICALEKLANGKKK